LENLDLEHQRETLVAQRDLLTQQLDAYRSVRDRDDESSARIPATEKAIADIEQQLTTLGRQMDRLELKASRPGRVLSPPNVPFVWTQREELPLWSGSPLDPTNVGCYLEPGTPLCLVGDASEVAATVIVPQDDVRFVRVEQRVELLFNGLPDRSLAGVVREISPVPVDVLPRELAATGVVPVDPEARDEGRPLDPAYRVRVELAGDETTTAPLRWSTGEARIRLAAEPLAYRLWRGVQRTFHFEL
jgi:putative peptide zinc metalloprotease protein